MENCKDFKKIKNAAFESTFPMGQNLSFLNSNEVSVGENDDCGFAKEIWVSLGRKSDG